MITPQIRTILWDFNGTLIDDVAICVESVNDQLARRGLPRLTMELYRSIFSIPVAEYLREIGFDFDAESMADVSAEFHDRYMERFSGCSLHEGVLQATARFARAGFTQFVLSAMEEVRLVSVLEAFDIADRFAAIYGLTHLEGSSKIERGRDLLRDFDIDPSTAVMIGDTDHDAEVADALGLESILVSIGHQSEARLRATGRPVVSTVPDLVDLLPA